MDIALFTVAWSSRELWSAFWWLISAGLGSVSAIHRMWHADGSQREFCQWKQEGVSPPEYVFTGQSFDSSTSFQLLLSKGRSLTRTMPLRLPCAFVRRDCSDPFAHAHACTPCSLCPATFPLGGPCEGYSPSSHTQQ